MLLEDDFTSYDYSNDVLSNKNNNEILNRNNNSKNKIKSNDSRIHSFIKSKKLSNSFKNDYEDDDINH